MDNYVKINDPSQHKELLNFLHENIQTVEIRGGGSIKGSDRWGVLLNIKTKKEEKIFYFGIMNTGEAFVHDWTIEEGEENGTCI